MPGMIADHAGGSVTATAVVEAWTAGSRRLTW
jgi:hypothetical protein